MWQTFDMISMVQSQKPKEISSPTMLGAFAKAFIVLFTEKISQQELVTFCAKNNELMFKYKMNCLVCHYFNFRLNFPPNLFYKNLSWSANTPSIFAKQNQKMSLGKTDSNESIRTLMKTAKKEQNITYYTCMHSDIGSRKILIRQVEFKLSILN